MASNSNTIRLTIRRKQSIDNAGKTKYMDPNVCVCAPDWVEEGLKQLSKYVPAGTRLQIQDGEKIIAYTVKEMTIQTLQMIARAQESNTTGKIDYSLYGDLKGHENVIRSIKDLVRQTIIVGPDWATHKGGYPNKSATLERLQPPVPVVLIDLIALQFQNTFNTGRLVCIAQNQFKGKLDDFIFEHVVGEPKASWKDAMGGFVTKGSDRYKFQNNILLDTHAYRQFVAKDFLLVCKALHVMDYTEVNLKFLRYGLGFFASKSSHCPKSCLH